MYRPIGLKVAPRATYIPQMCQMLEQKLGADLDIVSSEAIKSIGHERDSLSNFFFEGLLVLSQSKLDTDSTLKLAFFVVLIDFLHQTGYVKQKPEKLYFTDDPVFHVDELLDLAIGTRLPKWEASMIAGDKATIATLKRFFPEVIRRTAVINNERTRMYNRFRDYIGNIGFKLLTSQSASLSQQERSLLAIYSKVQQGTKMYPTRDMDAATVKLTPISPTENKEPLVLEVGKLMESIGAPGPCLNYRKLISNGILEQLLLYWGKHVGELKTSLGYMRRYGTFVMFKTTPEDSLPWSLKDQITGLTAQILNIFYRPETQAPFSLRVPLVIADSEHLYPDMPDLNLYLTDTKDCSNFWWDYYSDWRGRRISQKQGADLTYYLCDYAIKNKEGGGMPTELTEIPSETLLWLDDSVKPYVSSYDGNSQTPINEAYILPSAQGLQNVQTDMRAFYARFGNIELKPTFADALEIPTLWFMQPNERVVDYICSVHGLTIEERVIYTPVIYLCHNVARFKRLTGKNAPFDLTRLVLAILNRTGTIPGE